MNNLLNMIKFQLKLMFKTPILVVVFGGGPVLLTAIIGYLAQDSYGSGLSSYEFYSISMMVFTYLAAGLSSANNFVDESIMDGNIRVIYSPVKDYEIYTSQIITGTIFCALGITFSMIVFRFIFGINYNGSDFIIWLAFITLAFLSNTIGVFLCTITKSFITINVIFNIIQCVLGVLGGAFFSIDSLGKFAASLAKLSPVKWFIDGIFNSMYENSITLIALMIVINIILALILIISSKFTFKTEKYI